MTDALSVYGMAGELLLAANDCLATTEGGRISRAFVAHGEPAYDCCPQLTVYTVLVDHTRGPGAAPAPLDDTQRVARPVVPLVDLQVDSIRCVPALEDQAGNPVVPTAASLDQSARILAQDGWALWNGLRTLVRRQALWSGYPCRQITLTPATPTTPAGGCGGWTVTARVGLDGYDPFA